jgi:hypothetical protein
MFTVTTLGAGNLEPYVTLITGKLHAAFLRNLTALPHVIAVCVARLEV